MAIEISAFALIHPYMKLSVGIDNTLLPPPWTIVIVLRYCSSLLCAYVDALLPYPSYRTPSSPETQSASAVTLSICERMPLIAVCPSSVSESAVHLKVFIVLVSVISASRSIETRTLNGEVISLLSMLLDPKKQVSLYEMQREREKDAHVYPRTLCRCPSKQ